MPTLAEQWKARLGDDWRDELDRLSIDEIAAMEAEINATVAASGNPADYAQRHDSGFVRLAHTDLAARAIEETVLDAVNGTGPGRLIVNMPPRVGKSTLTSLWTPAWFLERWPDRQVILTTHTHNFSISWGRKVRDRLKRQIIAGTSHLSLSTATTAAGEWETAAGGGMLSTGIGGAITGRGAHLLLVDDPIKGIVEAHSQTVRDSQWNWWLGDASTRLEPGAAVIVLMTRWHEDDIVGRLLSREHEGNPDDWRVVRIPAMGEGETQDDAPPDALGRDVDEPLQLPQKPDMPHEELVAHWRNMRRSRGPYIWAGLYQQRPSEPEGTILRRRWWQFYYRDGNLLTFPDGRQVDIADLTPVQSWDMAFKDLDTSDWVVGQVWAKFGADRLLLDQWRGRADLPATIAAVKRLRARYPDTSTTWIEDAANGPAVISSLKRKLSGLNPRKPYGDKKSRAWAVQGDIEAGNVWLPSPEQAPWVRDLIDECAAFPNGAHDDQVDALTQALINLSQWGETRTLSPAGQPKAGGAGATPMTRRSISR